MNTNLVQWQLWDEEVDACFPWFTHGFLEWLKKQDLSEKRVLEFGGGKSSRWWRKKAKWVTTVETNREWTKQISEDCEGLDNGRILLVEVNEGDQENASIYTDCADKYGPYDIVVVDGILRNNCLEKAIKMNGLSLLIADNWNQSYVWMSDAAIEIMKDHKINVFEQPDHTDNDGVHKWKTVYWEIPAL